MHLFAYKAGQPQHTHIIFSDTAVFQHAVAVLELVPDGGSSRGATVKGGVVMVIFLGAACRVLAIGVANSALPALPRHLSSFELVPPPRDLE